MKKFNIISVILSIVFISGQVYATDRYMSTTGSDSGNCTNKSSPCRTLQYSMRQMDSGDTLWIADGTYTGPGNSIYGSELPPDGPGTGSGDARFTIIRATNIPCQDGVDCDQPLKVSFPDGGLVTLDPAGVDWVKIWGIKFGSRTDSYGNTIGNWNHAYFKQCAFQGNSDGNTEAFATNNSTYILLEDCVFFGKGRYKVLFYRSAGAAAEHNMCRRCVVRHDWANGDDGDANPIAGYSFYWSRSAALLNSIFIDSDDPSKWHNDPTQSFTAIIIPNENEPAAVNDVIEGFIAVNNAMSMYFEQEGTQGNTFNNVIGVKMAGGFLAKNGGATLSNTLLYDIGTDNFPKLSSSQLNKILGANNGVITWGSAPAINDTIFDDIAGDAVSGGATGDYINMYNIKGSKGMTATHLYTTDPESNGLTYPPRVEAGSPLASAGAGGTVLGPTIMKKLGKDGTFKGDTGWKTEQGDLWPWPMEEWVRAEMRAMDPIIGGDTMPSPTRGFCAPGQTLTKYIWEFLGNTCPDDICTSDGGGSSSKPSPPTNLRIMTQQ